jgi:hypothetical protein
MINDQKIYTSEDIPRINRLIEKFEEFIKSFRDLYFPGKKPTRFFGEYGELLVQPKLLNDFDIEMFGGQSRADLAIINRTTGIKKNVEVKLSSYKEEGWGKGWGFAINTKKIREDKIVKDFSYFDYLICIGLDNNYNPHFYIFTREEIIEHEREMNNPKRGRFKSGSHGIIIPHEISGKEELPNFYLKLLNNPDFLERWDKMK